MYLQITPATVDFYNAGGSLAGRYHYRDEFKPHFHPLNTPRGHTLSLVSPHDHKHHKGLMYALRTETSNFWEERATTSIETVGVQQHQEFDQVVGSGEVVGFVERLDWLTEAGGRAVISETREIRCRLEPVAGGYRWQWRTRLVALETCRLIQSQWSYVAADGRKTNYHGLGLRLRRDFGCGTGNNRLLLDGVEMPFTDGMGSAPKQAVYIGSIDGSWPVEQARAQVDQAQNNTMYVCSEPFAFLSMGPSNAAPLDWEAGTAIMEEYSVLIADE
jgi:hypothetical protein